MVQIHETGEGDLKHLQALWARGDVMAFVGFPNGLEQSDREMSDWLQWVRENRPLVNHYSVYEDDVYCGESFYRLDPSTGAAALDVKLLPAARGRGLGEGALTYAVFSAFQAGAKRVWVDPDPKNEKAIALYRRLGLVHRPMPPELYDPAYPNAYYMERTPDDPVPGGCSGHCQGCSGCGGK